MDTREVIHVPAGRMVGKWNSPYAVWWFAAHGSPGAADIGGPMMQKAGIVRASANRTLKPEDYEKYNLTNYRIANIKPSMDAEGNFLPVKVTVRITGAAVTGGNPSLRYIDAHCGGIFHLLLPSGVLRRVDRCPGEHPHLGFIPGGEVMAETVSKLLNALALDNALTDNVIDLALIPLVILRFVNLPFREQLWIAENKPSNRLRRVYVE